MVDGAPGFVPPGWSAWAVAGNGYPNFNYNLLVKTPGDGPAESRPLRRPPGATT